MHFATVNFDCGLLSYASLDGIHLKVEFEYDAISIRSKGLDFDENLSFTITDFEGYSYGQLSREGLDPDEIKKQAFQYLTNNDFHNAYILFIEQLPYGEECTQAKDAREELISKALSLQTI